MSAQGTGERITVPWGGEARRHVLPNGLTVLILPDPATPLASYQTWYRVGSRDETPGKTGIAHVMEHLLFGGAHVSEAGAFDRALERLGAEANASTWLDYTCYHEAFPAPALSTVLDLEVGRMKGLTIDPAVLGREIEVIANERRFRVEDSVDGAMDEALMRTAFRVHPYGNPMIGTMEDIRGLTIDDLSEFHEAHYAPANAVVVVAGGIAPGEAIREIEARMGTIGPARAAARKKAPAEPDQDAERCVTIDRTVPAARIVMGYRIPGIADPSSAALSVLATVLAGGESGRLTRRLVREMEAASSVAAWAGAFADPCLLEVHARLRRGRDPLEAIEAIDSVARDLAERGPEPWEIESARNRARLAFHLGLSTASGKAFQAGFFEAVAGGAEGIAERIRRIEGVDAPAVAAEARTRLVPGSRTVVVAVPEAS